MAKNASSVFGDDESNNDPLRQPRQDETADAGSPESDPTETPTAKPQRDDVDSSASRVRVPELRNLPFRTAREIANDTPSKMRWTVEGYAAPEIITELDGEIKHAGKTTWTSHMVKAIIEGERFMGLTTAKTKVVWLSEQTSKSFRTVLEKANLTECDDLFVLRWHDVADRKWADIVQDAVEFALAVEAGVLVVDTLGQFAGIEGDGENSAGEALEAMKPLQRAAGRGLSVILTRHERKSGRRVGKSGRGSSAFGGAADIILSLRLPEGGVRPTVRVLESVGRFDETPARIFIELTDEGYLYLGESMVSAEERASSEILPLLPTTNETAMPADEMEEKLEGRFGRTVVRDALKGLAESGKIRREGTGKRGSPHRYWKPRLTNAG